MNFPQQLSDRAGEAVRQSFSPIRVGRERPRGRLFRCAIVFLAGVALAACALGPSQSFDPQSAYPQSASSMSARATFPEGISQAKKRGLAFISWQGGSHGNVSIYALSNLERPIGTVTAGIHQPYGLAIDKAANLYVVNVAAYGSTNILKYAPPYSSAPIASYTDSRMSSGLYVTVRKDNAIWATDGSAGLYEFKPGRKQRAVFYENLGNLGGPTNPEGLAFNADGNLYVQMEFSDYGSGGVIELPNGTGSPTWLGMAQWSPGGIAFDKNNYLLIEDQCYYCGLSSPGIHVYGAPPNYNTNPYNITGPVFEYPHGATGLAIDRSSNHVFAALDGGVSEADEFSYPDGKRLKRTFNTGYDAFNIAVTPALVR